MRFISRTAIVARLDWNRTSKSTSKGMTMMPCSFPVFPFPLDLVKARFLRGAAEIDASSSADASTGMKSAFCLADLLRRPFCGGLFSSMLNVITGSGWWARLPLTRLYVILVPRADAQSPQSKLLHTTSTHLTIAAYMPRSRSDSRDRSRSPDRRIQLPEGVEPLKDSDYFQKSAEFRVWLKDEKGKVRYSSLQCPRVSLNDDFGPVF